MARGDSSSPDGGWVGESDIASGAGAEIADSGGVSVRLGLKLRR